MKFIGIDLGWSAVSAHFMLLTNSGKQSIALSSAIATTT
jgi:predicted RNase H-like nuclease